MRRKNTPLTCGDLSDAHFDLSCDFSCGFADPTQVGDVKTVVGFQAISQHPIKSGMVKPKQANESRPNESRPNESRNGVLRVRPRKARRKPIP